MTNGSVRSRHRDVNTRPGAAWTLVAAASALWAVSAALAQDEPLEVTLQVLDDVSKIEGVLMPLEEEPEHRTEADSAPPPESAPAETEDE